MAGQGFEPWTLQLATILCMAYRNREDQKRAAKRHYDANKAAYIERAKKHKQHQRQQLATNIRRLASCRTAPSSRYVVPVMMLGGHALARRGGRPGGPEVEPRARA